MLKYIITKQGKEYRRNTISDSHEDLMRDNHLDYSDILDEGIIEEGVHFSSRNMMPANLLRAREVETRYMYGITKEGD
jgi:hypothetical protein